MMNPWTFFFGLLPARFGLKFKLGIAFGLVAFASTAFLCICMCIMAKRDSVEIMQDQLADSASLIASMIDADELDKIKTPDDAKLPEYQRIQQTLQSLRKRTRDLANVYTMRLSAEGHPVFIVDEPSEKGKECAAIGEAVEDMGLIWEMRMRSTTLRLKPHADNFISIDRFGKWISGFAPIVDKSGNVRAFVGVDMYAGHFGQMQAHLTSLSIVLFLIVAPVAAFLGWLIGCGMAEPLIRLRDGVHRAMDFNFDFIATKASNDEIGDLTEAFNSMQERLRAAANRLVESEAKFKGIVESSPSGVLVFDSALRCVVANPSAAKIFGVADSSKLIGSDIFSLWSKPLLPEVRQKVDLAMSGQLCSFESKLDGSGSKEGFPVLAVLNSFTPASHSGLRLICLLSDISKMEEAKQALEQKNEFLRQFLESLPYPVFYKDEKGFYVDCNNAFLSFVGKPKGAVVGKPAAKVLPSMAPDVHIAVDEQILSGAKQVASYESNVQLFDGSSRNFMIYKAAYKTHSGAIGGLVGSFVDITERKLMEEENRRARALADAANYAKSRFLANVSYEIRTPLNCIVGIAEMLRETKLDKDQGELVGTLDESVRLLIEVIGDILDLAKIESGRLVLEELPCDLKELANSVVWTFAPQAERKGIAISCEIAESCQDWVFCDSARLRQILVNLIGNALKFTKSGSISLKLERLGAGGEARGIYKFSVSDTGGGIDPDKIEFVFDEFVQEDLSTSRSQMSHGLGLTLCRHLVLLMGGEINVESAKGVGSTFSFTLPLRGALDGAPQPEPQPGELNLSGARALVVDDYGPGAKLVRGILCSFGCVCMEAISGADAIDKFKSGEFDLLAMDLGLSDGAAYSLARKAREFERETSRKRCFIIAISSMLSAESREICTVSGVDAHVLKPVTKAQLASALQLRGCKGSSSAPA